MGRVAVQVLARTIARFITAKYMSEPKPITTAAELQAKREWVERVRADIKFSIGKDDAIGWVYVAKGLVEVIDECLRREAALKHAAQALVNAMETCHICTSGVIVDDSPIHCEDCSYDCEEHGPPSCVTLDIIHARLKRLIKSGTGSATQQTGENSDKEQK